MTRASLPIISIALCATIVACQPRSRIGEPDVDAASATIDGGGPDATGNDAGICDCGPTSCGTRECGRSACGHPCGPCTADEFCFAGGSCTAGDGPGTACADAFSLFGEGNVWEGDTGLRICPSDPTQVELCTCSGGGPDAWIDCAGSCFTPCVW